MENKINNEVLEILDRLKNEYSKENFPQNDSYRQDDLVSQLSTKVQIKDGESVKDLNSVIGQFVKNIIENNEFKTYLSLVKEDAKRIDEFISPGKSIHMCGDNEIIILRQWNSFTPILPENGTDNKGGGYFIKHNGKGIVIDPGYNFIEHFFNAGFKIDDIDYVFVTHAHDDHTGQLEAVLSILYKRNRGFWEKDIENVHKVKLFLNIGTFIKFSHILNLRQKNSDIERVEVLNVHQNYNVDKNLSVYTLKVQHNEVITNDYSLGFVFKLIDDDEECKIIRFTGDTGWNSKIEEENEKFMSLNQIEHINYLILHLGAIKDSELKYDFKKGFDENSDILYPNHLGLIGALSMIYKNTADLSIISEFGIELDEMRTKLTELINKELSPLITFPADVNMRIQIFKNKIRCSKSGKYFPPNEILAYRNSKGRLVYLSKDATNNPKSKVNIQSVVDEISVFDV